MRPATALIARQSLKLQAPTVARTSARPARLHRRGDSGGLRVAALRHGTQASADGDCYGHRYIVSRSAAPMHRRVGIPSGRRISAYGQRRPKGHGQSTLIRQRSVVQVHLGPPSSSLVNGTFWPGSAGSYCQRQRNAAELVAERRVRVIWAGCVLLGDVQLNRGPECDHRFGLSVAVRRELKFGAKSAGRGCRESQVAAIESACSSTRGQAESSTWFGRVRSAGEWEEPPDSDGRLRSADGDAQGGRWLGAGVWVRIVLLGWLVAGVRSLPGQRAVGGFLLDRLARAVPSEVPTRAPEPSAGSSPRRLAGWRRACPCR